MFSLALANAGTAIIMNASESTDPEEKPLNFTWYIDGTEVVGDGANDVVHTAQVTAGTHTVKVTVSTARSVIPQRRSRSASRTCSRSHVYHPMNKLNEERGSVMVTAILLMAVMMTLGFAVMSSVDTQTRQSRAERERESTFNLAEASLSAPDLHPGTPGHRPPEPPVSARGCPASRGRTPTSARCPRRSRRATTAPVRLTSTSRRPRTAGAPTCATTVTP